MSSRQVLRGTLAAILYPAVIFGSAGTWRWVEGWVFLAVLATFTVTLFRWLAKNDPALLAERMKGLFQPEQPTWDRVILGLFSLLWIGWLVLPGLDAVRFGWSDVPIGWKVAGGVLHVAGWWGIFATHRANTFLAPVVRVQADREHRVIDTGPYAIVRHPMYAAMFLWFPGGGLLLGSWWTTAFSVLPVLVLAVRTWFEDELLARDLAGYEDYRRRVRYRLVPGLW